jgi:hypothetical protein
MCVDTVQTAGAEIPPVWVAIRNRFDEVDAAGEGMLGKLIHAVVDDTGGDLAMLYACAISEALWEHSDRVREPLRHHTVGALEKAYAPVARDVYAKLAREFTKAAAALQSCAAIIDLEAPADRVIQSDAKQQRAWREGPEHCAVLDALVEPLRCAALLCGSPGECAGTAFDAPTLLIPLVIENVSSLHRRQVWRCWEDLVPAQAPPIQPMTTQNMREPEQPNPGRTGKWGKLLGINAVLRAHIHTPNGSSCIAAPNQRASGPNMARAVSHSWNTTPKTGTPRPTHRSRRIHGQASQARRALRQPPNQRQRLREFG